MQEKATARCVSYKEKNFVVYHKVTGFSLVVLENLQKSLTEMLVGWFGRRL